MKEFRKSALTVAAALCCCAAGSTRRYPAFQKTPEADKEEGTLRFVVQCRPRSMKQSAQGSSLSGFAGGPRE